MRPDVALPVLAQDRRGALLLHGCRGPGGAHLSRERPRARLRGRGHAARGSTRERKTIAAERGSCGFDWICIDLQHGFAGVESLLPMVQAAAITHTPVLVRVPRLDAGLIGRALGGGSWGGLSPRVTPAAGARGGVRPCRSPPDGVRSWGPARLTL